LGLEMNQRGYVVTDDHMRTSVKDIYAAGDLIEVTDWLTGDRKSVPIAGPANKQGRIAADTIVADAHKEEADGFTAGPSAHYEGTQGTSIARIFDLSCGSTGLNEKALKNSGKEFGKDYSYSLLHPQCHAGYFPQALPLTIKLIFSLEDGKVLGTQMIGYDGVDKRVDVVATAIRFHANIYDLTRLELAYAPPYSSAKDPVNLAGYAACNDYEGLTQPVTWEQALEATKQAGHKLLDIRENTERLTGVIEGAQHIPLTELRERIEELEDSQIYYVFCAVGLRGYLAERLLKQRGFETRNILGGTRTWKALTEEIKAPPSDDDLTESSANTSQSTTAVPSSAAVKTDSAGTVNIEPLNVCGLSCPGPIVEVAKAMESLEPGTHLYVTATDPGFTKDIDSWCDNTGHRLVKKGRDGKEWYAEIEKIAPGSTDASARACPTAKSNEKTMIVFSGDLDKAIASFIIANGAAAMGNKVNMFFTFWGLNILRRDNKVPIKKDFMSKMFSGMMPRGSRRLGLSKMNFGGAGKNMIRNVMKKKNIASLEELIKQAQDAGVKMTACQMSMDVMGITHEELIDGVEVGGVATMLNDNDRSNMNLFI
ncbi:MAG TPA: FAD-dependent oxidoreductase, partial [Clostridiaceae bacterium]|nr:FAD-dependent oxidoreductase [Clostridiaceae bacterium]